MVMGAFAGFLESGAELGLGAGGLSGSHTQKVTQRMIPFI